MEYLNMWGMYTLVAVLWGAFSTLIIYKRTPQEKITLLISFIVHTVLCPFTMVLAIMSIWSGDTVVKF